MKSLITTILILGTIGVVVGIAVKAATENISATVTPMQVALTVSPTSTTYSSMDVSTVKKADTASSSDEFIITNTGNVAETFNVLGADATGGTGWAISTSTVGTNIYMHAYSANKTLTASTTLGSVGDQATKWVALDKGTSYRTLATNIASSTKQDLVLELLTPSSVGDYAVKSTTVTVQATLYE